MGRRNKRKEGGRKEGRKAVRAGRGCIYRREKGRKGEKGKNEGRE